MSYFSEQEYKAKRSGDLWLEKLYFDRWFKNFDEPILDIGCATGNFIAVAPEKIEGIEVDGDCLKIAKERGFSVRQINADREMHILESDKYQGVYAKHVIEHLERPLNFLNEIKRILKLGGKAIILTPNCPYMLERGFWDDYTHRRPFTKRSLEMIAFDAGFMNVKIYEDFRCFPGLGRLMRLLNVKPKTVRFLQSLIGIRGLSLILELTKN